MLQRLQCFGENSSGRLLLTLVPLQLTDQKRSARPFERHIQTVVFDDRSCR